MDLFVSYTITGLFFGAAYAVAASGLVLTYTTTRVFNLAHGATSMLMAFLYWQLRVSEGLPTWLAVALVLFVIAPLYGVLLERLVMRRLVDSPVSVVLVVTLGLFVLLIGIAQSVWPADQERSVPRFFGYDSFPILGVTMWYHYLITIIVAGLAAAGLYLLLNRTRIGTAMRAAVDNRELLALFGARANRVSALSWALGSSLAGLAGVLLVSETGVDYYALTFLVINSFAAAMLGRLSSLPLTYAGAMILGLLVGFSRYVHSPQFVADGLQTSLPTLMLFGILLFVPQVRLRVGQVKGILAANVPSGRRAITGAGGLIAATLLVLPLLDATDTQRFGIAVTYAIVMLSLVLLTGYGGYVSLAQLSFVGVGATVVAKLDTSSPIAVLVAVVVSAAVGALVSLSVLRLTGLYLALATIAFGQLMDNLVFKSDKLYAFGKSLSVKRMTLFGYDFSNTKTYVFFMVAVFAVLAIGLLALRRGPIGRLLIALRDSPAACGTLGLNQRWFRVGVFTVSAGIAGLGGALLAGLHEFASADDFQTMYSLSLLLAVVVAGVTTMTGAFTGGLLLMLLPVLASTSKSLAGLELVVLGFGAIMLGRDPNGLVNLFFRLVRGSGLRLPLPQRAAAFGASEPAAGAPAGIESESRSEKQVAGHGVA